MLMCSNSAEGSSAAEWRRAEPGNSFARASIDFQGTRGAYSVGVACATYPGAFWLLIHERKSSIAPFTAEWWCIELEDSF